MNLFVRRLLPVSLACLAALVLPGCFGSETDLAEEYNLEATADQRTPAKTIASLVDSFIAELSSRENSDPASSVAMLNENLEGFDASQFGDKAAEFEKIKTGAQEMQAMVDKGATKAQLQEKASALQTAAQQLAGPAAPE